MPRKTAVTVSAVNAWMNKIVGFEWVDPREIKANAKNFRVHPPEQREALLTSIGSVGWMDVIKVNQNSGNIVDGHLRVDEAIQNGQERVPVVWLDLTPHEETQALLMLDPISAMAKTDENILNAIINEALNNSNDDRVIQYIENVRAEYIGDMQEKIREREVTIKPKHTMHILISAPIDEALNAKAVIEQLESNQKVRVIYGAN